MASDAFFVAQYHEKCLLHNFYEKRRFTTPTQIFLYESSQDTTRNPHQHKRVRIFHQTLSHSDSDQENFVSDEKNKNIAENQIKTD